MRPDVLFGEAFSDSEQKILDQITAAGPSRVVRGQLDEGEKLSAGFLYWLIREKLSRLAPIASRFELVNATIEAPLDLSSSKVEYDCCFHGCHFRSGLLLADASIPALELSACDGYEIQASRAEIDGQLTIDGGSFGTILLTGARIRGGLDLNCALGDHAQPLEPDVLAFAADGLWTEGTFDLSGINARGEVRLNGARIGRDLRCHAMQVTNPGGWSLSAAGAVIGGSVYLGRRDAPEGQARIGHSNFSGSVHLDGATIAGNLDADRSEFAACCFVFDELPKGFREFDGHLDAIRAGGAKVGGSIKLQSILAKGTVWLADVEVGGNFDCTNARFDFPGEAALWADGIQVTGSTYISSLGSNFDKQKLNTWVESGNWEGGFTTGLLRFVNATLKRGLTVANFYFSSEGPARPLRRDPDLLIRSSVGKKIWRPRPDAPDPDWRGVCGIYAPHCQIGGRLVWQKIWIGRNSDRTQLLSLFNAKADVLDYAPGLHLGLNFRQGDDWDVKGILDFNQFEYSEIANLEVKSVDGWLKRLDDQYARGNQPGFRKNLTLAALLIADRSRRWCGIKASFLLARQTGAGPDTEFLLPIRSRRRRWITGVRRWGTGQGRYDDQSRDFVPEPYLQLANVVRGAGYDRAADNILLRLDRNRTRWGDLGAWRQIAEWMYDCAIKRGFAVFRPLWLLAVLWLMSGYAFDAANRAHDFKPAKVEQTGGSAPILWIADKPASEAAAPLVSFSPWAYAFEAVFPLVTLDQKQNWVFDTPRQAAIDARPASVWESTEERLAHVLIVLDPILGWILGLFLATGVAGLIRSQRR